MAAVYQTGTNAISATSGVDMRTALDAAILTHPNWSLVEAISITGGTSRVYKCAGTGGNANSWGVDFYIALTVFTATPLALVFQVFEAYTPAATSQAVRATRSTSGTLNVAAPGSNSGFVIDNTGYTLDNATANINRNTLTLDGTNTWSWMAHVSKSRLEVSVMNGAAATPNCFIGGVYVPNPRAVASNASVFPLFSVASTSPISTGLTSNASFSRAYLTGALAIGNVGGLAASSMNIAGAISTAGALSDGVEATVRGTGVVMTAGQVPNSSAATPVGFLRGSLPGFYVFGAASTNYPRPLDLLVLSDATRLAPLASPGSSMLLLTNVDADS